MKKFLNDPSSSSTRCWKASLPRTPTSLPSRREPALHRARGGARTRARSGSPPAAARVTCPLFLGYVGKGMLDGCSVGGVFQSPSAEQMHNVTRAIDGGAGVLYIYGNYGGDSMNFDMAKDMAAMETSPWSRWSGAEDVASAPKGQEGKRRGVAGHLLPLQVRRRHGRHRAPLAEVKRIAEKAAANVRTMGVALSSNIIPEVGTPHFDIGEYEMEIGMGIHGEPGVRRGPLRTADAIVDEMMASVLPDLPFAGGSEVAVLVNGLGATRRRSLNSFRTRSSRKVPEPAKT